MKNFLEEKNQKSGPAGRKKDETERVTGLGRRTREEIVKWNQMTAPRFRTGGRHQTSPASLRGISQRPLAQPFVAVVEGSMLETAAGSLRTHLLGCNLGRADDVVQLVKDLDTLRQLAVAHQHNVARASRR